MIEQTIDDLDLCLHGPARVKDRLLGEAARGLTDAVQAYRDAGLDEARARAMAVQDFGPVSDIRGAFQTELDDAVSRHLAWTCLLLLPLFALYWNVLWELNPYPVWPVGSGLFILAVVAAIVGQAASASAVVQLARHRRSRQPWDRAVTSIRWLAGTGTGTFGAAVLILVLPHPETIVWLPTTGAIATALALGAGVRRLNRCARL